MDRRALAEIFSALASEQRLKIVEMIAAGEVECQEIISRLDLSQSAVSYHLCKLEHAGVLKKEKKGSRNCYRVKESVKQMINILKSRRENGP
jgi:ArsR family transcriptional regulator